MVNTDPDRNPPWMTESRVVGCTPPLPCRSIAPGHTAWPALRLNIVYAQRSTTSSCRLRRARATSSGRENCENSMIAVLPVSRSAPIWLIYWMKLS